MKLKNRIYISFFVIVLVPLLLTGIAFWGFAVYQVRSLQKQYGIEEITYENLSNNTYMLNKITQKLCTSLQKTVETEPDKMEDFGYLDNINRELNEKNAYLVVRKGDVITYNKSGLDSRVIASELPMYGDMPGENDKGVYIGKDIQALVKQVDFRFPDDTEGTAFVMIRADAMVPRMQSMMMNLILIVVLILAVTAFGLCTWTYHGVITPLAQLKVATKNIKEGNLDFTIEKMGVEEIGNLCEDFEEMRKRLKQTNEEKLAFDKENRELISNISHDLKTPITAVKGYVEGIMDGVADTPEKQHRYMQTIANKVNDMDKLIDALTIYSKLDTNRVPYSFSRINLKDYFDDCCEEIRVDLEAQDIDLVYQCHNVDEVYIYADVEQLKRVINNIISNSVKYMKEGRKGRIEINLYDEGDYAHIIMTDNGMGIGTSDLPHIFDRFYRTDESRNSKQGGSGIGLAIVRKIIEDHKGKIWAESVEGEGTTMHICLRKDIDTSKYIMQGETKNE